MTRGSLSINRLDKEGDSKSCSLVTPLIHSLGWSPIVRKTLTFFRALYTFVIFPHFIRLWTASAQKVQQPIAGGLQRIIGNGNAIA